MAHDLQYYQARLAEVESALTELTTNGRQYSIPGNHSKTSASLDDLLRLQSVYKRAILRRNGVRSSVTPDFSDGGKTGTSATPNHEV